MPPRKKTDYSGLPQGEGHPQDNSDKGTPAKLANFDTDKFNRYLDDWLATRKEIAQAKATYIAPLEEHLKDGRKLAKEEGFDATLMMEIVKEAEELEKQGVDVVRARSELRDLYRLQAKHLGWER